MFMAPVIVGLLGRFLTDSSYGLYAFVLRELGIFEKDILGTSSSALTAVILMDVWEWTPLIVLIVLAGLASVNQYVIEAAKVDGANYLERLRYIVAPSIAGVVVVALARPFDGRHPLLRHYHGHHQRRTGQHDQDNPHKAVRDGLPLLRPRLRGGHRARDAGVLDPGRQRFRRILESRGLAK